MADPSGAARSQPLAVVGLACRFPDADDPAALLDVVLTGRRTFRRLPPGRIDIGDYYLADPSTSDATYSTRAAVIEGWQFEPAAFGIDKAAYTAADPANWLALETSARALAAAGLPAGTGLDRDRTGVIIGNTLAGDTSRANGLRVRWPYVRRVLADALDTGEIPADQAGTVLQLAENSYLAPFPPMGPYSLAGSMPGTIAAAISTYFGFRGGSHAVDSDCSSSLQAVASACAALVAGELDAAIAGGVDLSLDPLELIGLAKAGLLATSDVRVYDEVPSGYLPGEGCGIVVLMRTADARAAGLPVYAEILGWGTSGGGMPGEPQSHASSQLLAMQRAYERGGVDPTDIHFIEGNGAGTPLDDQAELTALNSIRAGARRTAALGSVKANIGHAKAAAGAAGLIKTVLALGTGVVPPTTGVDRPHELITSGDARLVLPEAAQDWEAGTRLAAVSTTSLGGSNVHVVLRHEPAGRGRQDRWLRSVPLLAKAAAAGRAGTDGAPPHPITGPEPRPFLLHAPDRFALAEMLFRIAEIAGGMSDAEMQDLACMLGRDPGRQGRARVAIVATRQEQLAVLAREAIALLPQLADGLITARPGVFAADDADGRVTLLLSGGTAGAALRPGVMRSLDNLRWLEALDVSATAAVGHGLGALAGLAWAGVLGESEVVEIVKLREQFVSRSADRGRTIEADAAGEVADSGSDGHLSARHDAASLRTAIAQRFRFGPPRRRLISTVTGAEISSVDDAIDLICNGLDGADRHAEAIAEGAIGASLLLETGPGSALVTAAANITDVPAISLQAGSGDRTDRALVAAALFAAGAMGQPQALFAGQRTRPIDFWRDQTFITNPCQLVPQQRQADEDAAPGSAKTEITAAEITDTQITDTATADTEIIDAEASGAATSETEITETEITDTEITGTGTTDDSEITETDTAGTGTTDDSEITETDTAGTGTTGTAAEAVESPDQSSSVPSYRAPSTSNPAPMQRPVDGIAPWARCFAEGLRPVRRPLLPASIRPWRLYAAASSPVLADLGGVFTPDPAAGRTLAIVEDPADHRSRAAAIAAAKDAMATGELVVLTTSSAFTGFFASLHAEHPSIGITVLRVTVAAISPAAILPYAAAEPGQFRELIFGASGAINEPMLTEVPLAGAAAFPLGPDDVLLITHGTKDAGLALARVVACCGAGVAVVGRAGDKDDGEFVAGLEELRSAGARVGYEVIDIADPASLTAAIRRIEDQLGPVTAIGHAAGLDYPVPVQDIPEPEATALVGDEAAVLDLLATSIPAGQLRLIISLGTVASRYGLAGASLHALSSGALASRAVQLATASIGCEVLHLDLPASSSGGLGDAPELPARLAAADNSALDVTVASRLLLKVMTTPGLPRSLAVHGRVSGLAAVPPPVITAAELAAAGLPGGGRFLREVAVHCQGIELVCSATLSLATDPYLADYCIDGMPVLPPVLTLEALAQAASVLAGRPVRRLARVAMESPVLIPVGGEAALRICALRDGDTIVAALRCADSSYLVDHARAEFSIAPEAREMPEAAIAAASPALAQLAPGPSGLVDGTELYGPISFQSGRFRRIALMPEVTAKSGRALARGADDQPWFTADGPFADSTFLLGSPGLNDAALQVLQACVPHRRVRPAGCESVQFSGRIGEGPIEIRAVAEPARVGPGLPHVPSQAMAPASEMAAAAQANGVVTGAGLLASAAEVGGHSDADLSTEERADQGLTERPPHSRKSRRNRRRRNGYATAQSVNPGNGQGSRADETPDLAANTRQEAAPKPASEPAPQRWNVEAVDAAGQLLAAWRGIQLRDSGPLPRNTAWPPTLLSVFLERCAVDLGLDESLRVTVSCGQPDWPLPQLLSAVPLQAAGADSKAPAEGRHAGPERRALNTVKAPGVGALAGFGLMLRAPVPVACGWVTVQPGHRHHEPPPGMASAFAQLRADLAEPRTVLTARLNAIGACLQMAHLQADGSGSGADQLNVTRTTGDGWAVLSLGRAVIACAVVELSGVSAPVAVAMLTRQYAHARGPGAVMVRR